MGLKAGLLGWDLRIGHMKFKERGKIGFTSRGDMHDYPQNGRQVSCGMVKAKYFPIF